MNNSSVLLLVVIGVLATTNIALVFTRSRNSGNVSATQLRAHIADATRTSLIEAGRILDEATALRLQTATTSIEAQSRATTISINDILNPVKEALARLSGSVIDLENKRVEAYSRLDQQVQNTATVLESLRHETVTLSSAMRRHDTRGRWGELQLRRIIEMIGMTERVSFVEQKQQVGEGAGKPDVTVLLPGGRVLYIDSKTPMEAFFKANEATDFNERQSHFVAHAQAVKSHIKTLTQRSYSQDQQSLDYVIMFLPTEPSLSSACEVFPDLIEVAANSGVILTSPTSLIALLSNISMLWQEETRAKNAQEILKESIDLHSRLKVFVSHISSLGENLGKSVAHFNKAVGSFDNRVMPAARRVEELAGIREPIQTLSPIDSTPMSSRFDSNLIDDE
ncbi:MAG: DNA recombination protein RmuC [Actinobacteria bacterium]|uniref:Unannotated protein n=1 Tax=freshwater metagenome TaxID=449393 RepID=A0A6J5Z661_9ZZZZ|nr:DNA recombination protein RmuC [Actinomycetota bacterium]